MTQAAHSFFQKTCSIIVAMTLCLSLDACAKLKLPTIISDNMVLQRDQSDPVWGWDAPGTKVSVSIGTQTKTATADANGKWMMKLDPMAATNSPLTMTVKGSDTITIKNILVGEVWLCSGQSNMAMQLKDAWNADVEAATMKLPDIRFVTVPNVASPRPLDDFAGTWTACTPETSREFSALALFYGRYLHHALGVPIGLINNAWGGSYIEAWMDRRTLENDPQFKDTIEAHRKLEARATNPAKLKDFEDGLIEFETTAAEWREAMKTDPKSNPPRPRRPQDPRDFLSGNWRVSNLFNGVLHPVMGFGIRGAIWYQGEANLKDAWRYRQLFPAMIADWRRTWAQGDFPFYLVQLPNIGAEDDEPIDSQWAELRESQTKALSVPHTGQAVTIDLGDPDNLHPKNKLDVAARLARWALANDYGVSMPCRSPEFKSMSVENGKVTITFAYPGTGLCTEHVERVKGFTICGEDKMWQWAQATIIAPDKVIVWDDETTKPVAVRYGWSDNPGCNLYSKDGLAVTPFRTDDFELSTQPEFFKE